METNWLLNTAEAPALNFISQCHSDHSVEVSGCVVCPPEHSFGQFFPSCALRTPGLVDRLGMGELRLRKGQQLGSPSHLQPVSTLLILQRALCKISSWEEEGRIVFGSFLPNASIVVSVELVLSLLSHAILGI